PPTTATSKVVRQASIPDTSLEIAGLPAFVKGVIVEHASGSGEGPDLAIVRHPDPRRILPEALPSDHADQLEAVRTAQRTPGAFLRLFEKRLVLFQDDLEIDQRPFCLVMGRDQAHGLIHTRHQQGPGLVVRGVNSPDVLETEPGSSLETARYIFGVSDGVERVM